jgi:hypothetical protein
MQTASLFKHITFVGACKDICGISGFSLQALCFTHHLSLITELMRGVPEGMRVRLTPA